MSKTGYSKAPGYDAIVFGGGTAGTIAAIAAAQNNARTLLVESQGTVGGESVTGLPFLGVCNSRGEWIVKGVLQRLLDDCRKRGGYVGRICDWRTVYGVCVNPDIFRLCLIDMLEESGVELLLHTSLSEVTSNSGRINHCTVLDRSGTRKELAADFFVDATGHAVLAALAGAATEGGTDADTVQPISLVFRMANVDFDLLLSFVRDNPHEVLLAENPVFKKTPEQCAAELCNHGYPYLALSARGSVLGNAIKDGSMYPCTAVFMSPTSLNRREVTLNTTRISGMNPGDIQSLSAALPELSKQVSIATSFLKNHVPGFYNSEISAIAHHIGIRETRRILGKATLQTEAVAEGKKDSEGIAKGAHHIDIHGSGTQQTRIPVKDGRSYDIPYGCLIPKDFSNLLAVGRCLSSTREANGSARVTGTCMATGEAAGTAVAMCVSGNVSNVAALPVQTLRQQLRRQGAVLEGTG